MNKSDNSLRLIFPQWQGGNNPPYYFGTQLLNWLAPAAKGTVEEVDVPEPTAEALKNEDGIVGKKFLLQQLKDAQEKIEKHQPDKIVVLGGDCLVDLAPFAYLNERYEGDLAILWIDSHPDIMTPNEFEHAHAHVLGNLLGRGDSDFTKDIKKFVKSENVCYLGVNEPSEWENDEMIKLGLKNITPEQYKKQGSDAVIEWFKSTGAKHLAVHFDLDAIDPSTFRSLLFAKLGAEENEFEGIAQGKLTMKDITKVLQDVSKVSNIVGLGIAEHLPWDAIAMKKMLEELPLIGK
jgi:arginase